MTERAESGWWEWSTRVSNMFWGDVSVQEGMASNFERYKGRFGDYHIKEMVDSFWFFIFLTSNL